jgi:hypothetical protein
MPTKLGRRAALAVEPLEARDAPSATQYVLRGPPTAVAGAAVPIIVQAVDGGGVIDPSYTGTITFTSTDPQAVLPGDYTFTAADAGQHVFGVTLLTVGPQSVIGTDTASSSLTGSAPVFVTASGTPGVQLVASSPEIVVGSTETLAGALPYPSEMPVTVSLDWGDGSSPTTLQLRPGLVTFTASHTYQVSSDNTPTGAFTVQALATGGYSPPLTGTVDVTVDSLAPAVAMDNYYVSANVGDVVTLTGTYSGPGGKPLTATVDFGDGTDPLPVTLLPNGTFVVSHVFTDEDVYDVTVTVDDGTNTASDDTLALVFSPDLENGTSQAVAPGAEVTASAPGISARADHAAGSARPAVLTVGRYDALPVSAPDLFSTAGYELRLAGAGANDRVTVTFSVPAGFEDGARLEFYDPRTHTFRLVQLSPGSFTIDEAGRTITLVLDMTSFPRVTDLRGTIFTIAVSVPEAVPPAAGVAFVSTSGAAPPTFSSGGQRTLSLSPSTDGGPSVAQALLSGERRHSVADLAAEQVAMAADPWPVGKDAPLAGLAPTAAAGEGGDPRQEDPPETFLLWPLTPTTVVPVWPLNEPLPKEASDQGALSRPRQDDDWTSASLVALALALPLTSPKRERGMHRGENPFRRRPI